MQVSQTKQIEEIVKIKLDMQSVVDYMKEDIKNTLGYFLQRSKSHLSTMLGCTPKIGFSTPNPKDLLSENLSSSEQLDYLAYARDFIAKI